MGNTYKNKAHDGYYRRCKGHKNARINNARTIPPDGWNVEKYPCRINHIPWKVVDRMFEDGWPEYEAFERVMKKFKLSRKQASEITNFFYHRTFWYKGGKPVPENKTPDGYLKVWKITRFKVNKYK